MTLDHVGADLRYAFRTFLRRPGMALLAVVTLSLGIGASTAMFSIIDSVLLRPAPYPEPENLYSVYPAWPAMRGHPTLGTLADRGTWSWPEFFVAHERQTSFESLAAYQVVRMTLSGEGRPEQVALGEATHALFPMLGVVPLLGRLFHAEDGLEGSDDVVLLTAGYWRDGFASDPDVLGRTLRLNDQPYEIVGVLPDDFAITSVDARMWKPKAGSPTDPGMSNHGSTRVLGRLASGVTVEQSQADIARILREDLPAGHGEHEASVFLTQSEETRTVRPVLLVLLIASGLLLAVACGNVAALLLGAGIDRERELAVRGAVGATRGRIAQQLLSESTLLALLGAIGGIAITSGAIRALVYLAPPGVPRLEQAAINPMVLLFAVVIALVCGVGFGSIPALSLSSTDLASSMGSSRSTHKQRARLQSIVVVGELALATVLVFGGVLLARTVVALDSIDPGFDQSGLIVASLAAPIQRFRGETSEAGEAALDGYMQQMKDEVQALPGVSHVAFTSAPPFFGWRGNNDVRPEGWQDGDEAIIAERRFVSVGFFATLDIPIVEGRVFDANDEAEGAPGVVVISQGLADLAFPGESAIGRRLDYWSVDATVVGVAANVRDHELQRVTELAYYAPARQVGALEGPLVIRTSGDALEMIPAVRDRIWSVDPDVPITRTAVMTELMAEDVASQRYRARLMAVFAGLAALFSLMGIYGVTARSVARRTQEMGIRVALGAATGHVRRLVTAQAVRLAVLGVTVGILAAVAMGGVLDSFLWGVTRTDPVTIVGIAVLLPVFAAIAAVPPARRATKVDPLVALKSE